MKLPICKDIIIGKGSWLVIAGHVGTQILLADNRASSTR